MSLYKAQESSVKINLYSKLIGFKENKSDLCLLSKWSQYGVIMIGIYVDNCLMVGKRYGIDELKKSGFSLKIENIITDNLNCQLLENAR
jgi:hypothetical protein